MLQGPFKQQITQNKHKNVENMALNGPSKGHLLMVWKLRQEDSLASLDLSWKCAHQVIQNFPHLQKSMNDWESVTSFDFEVTDMFWEVSKFLDTFRSIIFRNFWSEKDNWHSFLTTYIKYSLSIWWKPLEYGFYPILNTIQILYSTYHLLIHYLYNDMSLALESNLYEDRHFILFSLIFPWLPRVLVPE